MVISVTIDSALAGQSQFNSTDIAGKQFTVRRKVNGELQSVDYFVTVTGFSVDKPFALGDEYVIAVEQDRYTNGYEIGRTMGALRGRMGFLGQIPSTRSGRWFDSFHSVVNAQNIHATMPEGDLITHLKNLEQSAITTVLSNVFRECVVLDQGELFIGNNEQARIVSGTNFAGIELYIVPKHTVQVNAVSLRFAATGTVVLQLFKEGRKTAIWSQSVSVIDDTITVPIESLYLTSGRYWLGYDQSTSPDGVATDSTWCKTTVFAAIPVTVIGDRFDQAQYTDDSAINLNVTAFRDYTADIIARPGLFDEAIGLQVAYNVLEGVIYTTRSNGRERLLADAADKVGLQMDLNGYAPVSDLSKVEGLAQRIRKELCL